MLKLSTDQKVYLYREPVDMRKSFDGLIAATRNLLKRDPLCGALFVFCNRKGNYVKCLAWDRTGYVLYAKRLERGKFKIFLEAEQQTLTQQQLLFLLDGIPIGVRSEMR